MSDKHDRHSLAGNEGFGQADSISIASILLANELKTHSCRPFGRSFNLFELFAQFSVVGLSNRAVVLLL